MVYFDSESFSGLAGSNGIRAMDMGCIWAGSSNRRVPVLNICILDPEEVWTCHSFLYVPWTTILPIPKTPSQLSRAVK